MAKPKKSKRTRRPASGSVQPPNRGHGSSHAKKRSRQPSAPLTTPGIADSIRTKLRKQGKPRNEIEAMADDSLHRADAARNEAIAKAKERRRREEARSPQRTQTSRLAPEDRRLLEDVMGAMGRLTQALDAHTAALQETGAPPEDPDSAVQAASDDQPPASAEPLEDTEDTEDTEAVAG